MDTIDNIADRLKVFGDLDVTNKRVPFEKLMKTRFTRFDSRQRFTCVKKFLDSQIDFDYYSNQGVILDHYPLHNLASADDIRTSIWLHWFPLQLRLIFGDWMNYAQPVHIIKKYYGERYAFFFAYFLQYQAWLFFPSLVGVIIFGYQMYDAANYGLNYRTFDVPLSSFCGIFFSIWATLAVEAWKRVQGRLMFKWDMDNPQDVLTNDERPNGQFSFQYEYNADVNKKMKIAIERKWWVKPLNYAFNLVMITLTALTIWWFEG